MKRGMDPVRTSDGVLAPERDRRWVPLATMAAYEGVTPSTVYLRMLDGQYPAAGTKRFGRDVRYLPAVIYGERIIGEANAAGGAQ